VAGSCRKWISPVRFWQKKVAQRRTVTIAVDGMKFLKPVQVGDVVCCYGKIGRIGNTSLTLHLETWVKPVLRKVESRETRFKVTEANFTFVAVDENGKKRPVPKGMTRRRSEGRQSSCRFGTQQTIPAGLDERWIIVW
jgi:acyl-CoA hydrolase